jgi:hypothetical protein
MEGRIQCNTRFDADLLQQINFISTMSLIRREHFPGFDESIERLQDWDLWLSMLREGHIGAYCEHVVFTTRQGEGITYGGNGPTWEEAVAIVKQKHGLA